jgi:hypothetical protein
MKPVKPSLLIKKEILDFSRAPQTDAEGQIARRRFVTEAPIGPQGGAGVGQIPAVIEYQTGAGQLADSVQSNCGSCRFHDRKAWRQYVSRMTGPASSAEDRQTIQTLRARILMNGVGVFDANDELDVEATLGKFFGICQPLSEWTKGVVGENPIHWPVATTRDAACPTTIAVAGHTMQVVTPAEPLGLFKPKDLDATKLGAARRDAVLFDAMGKPRL